MQVAKFWRKNQLRYRLEGLVQQKADIINKLNQEQRVNTPKEKIADSKVKVA